MLDWLKRNPQKQRRAASQLIEGMREVGILNIAFAPLDVALGGTYAPGLARTGLLFITIGLFLFFAAMVLTWRRKP